MKIHEARTFAPCKEFFFVFVVFSSLENYFGFRTNARVKTDHSISRRWNKTF